MAYLSFCRPTLKTQKAEGPSSGRHHNSDQINTFIMSALSESQLKALGTIPHITGAFSTVGSFSILYDIWKDRQQKLKRPYYRILLGISSFDLVSSIAFGLSTIPMPVNTPFVYHPQGTTQTCTAQGFFVQLMLGSIFYNFVLALYYTLSGKYKISDEEFAKKYEPFLHGAAIAITLGFSVGETSYTVLARSLSSIEFSFLKNNVICTQHTLSWSTIIHVQCSADHLPDLDPPIFK